jgi:hypothetical protein
VSALHQLNDNSFPVHGELTVRIKPVKEIRKEWEDKIIIQRNGGSAIIKPEGQINSSDKWLSFKTGSFGSFVALLDLAPPVINELGKGDTINLSPASRILFSPSDISGIKKFRAELNGSWLMFTNDKGYSYIYNFDERCPYGVHHLKVTAEDLVGNITTKEWWFKRGPYTPPKKKKTSAKKKPAGKKKKTAKK